MARLTYVRGGTSHDLAQVRIRQLLGICEMHHYLIQIEHGYQRTSEILEFEALGSAMAISRLDRIPHKRRAIVYEDGKKVADLTFLEGF